MFITVINSYAQGDLKKSTKINTPILQNNDSSKLGVTQIGALTLPKDTLKNVKIDTLEDDGEPLESKIIYNARDSIRYETAGNKIFLFGDGYVKYEEMELKAEFFEIDNEKNTITAFGKKDSLGKSTGNPVFNDGEKELVCSKMIYNLKTKKGKIFDIVTKEGDLILMGKEVKKDSNNVTYFNNLSCIPCENADSRTIFKAKRAKIIPDDKIVTGPLYLEIGGVPTPLGLPFGYIPNTKKRHSGILIPFYGNSDNLGFYLKDGGFYWGINDKTDMTIRGDIYSYGSWGLRTLNNYNVNYKYNGSLSLGYSEFLSGEKEVPSTYTKKKDISINWIHNQDQKNNPSTRFSSNVNIRTSKYNTLNAINTGDYLTNTFQSNINYTKSFKLSALSINARHNQNTQTKQMDLSFPELTFNLNRFYPFKNESRIKQNPFDKIGISYLFEARNTLSGKDTTIFKGNIADSLKYGARHTLPISTNITLFKYFTMTPAINLSAVMYTKTTEKNFDYNTNKIYTSTQNEFKTGYDANFNTSFTTKLFMDYLFKSKAVKQIRHLLIPTINYTYRPDFGEKQYGFWKEVLIDTVSNKYTKYSVFEKNLFGGPIQGKQNSIGLNLSNNLEAKIRKNSDTGAVYNKVTILQNLSFNGLYNLAADSFKMSIISATGRTKLWKFFDLVFNSNFDPYSFDYNTNYRSKNYEYNKTGKLARFTNGNISLNATFSSSALRQTSKKPDLTNGAEKGAITTNTAQTQEQLPWNLVVYYNIAFDRQSISSFKKIQTLNFSGDINVTKYWKIGLTSGYDFTNKNLSYTSVNIYRDLHCWEARIDWVPFGFRKSYSLTINLKSSMFSDIKIPRTRQWYDNN